MIEVLKEIIMRENCILLNADSTYPRKQIIMLTVLYQTVWQKTVM